MIEGLKRALAASSQPGVAELESALAETFGHPDAPAKLVAHEQLKARVFRLRLQAGNGVRSFVAKRLKPHEARRNQLAIRRWLPSQGFSGATPALLAIAAERTGSWVWHVYEDLDGRMVDPEDSDQDRLASVVRLIASIHSRFAEDPLLAECRLHGDSFGPSFFAGNVGDAIHALELLRPPRLALSVEQAELRDRLLARLHRLLDEEPMRARELAEFGGPETLLHGDLWTTNIFVASAAAGSRVRLIDWDHAGVGPASYDLSTFLLRFAPERRASIVALYRQSLENGGWRMPGRRELNRLFETAELARYANRAIWPAIALLRERAEWGFPALAAVEGWFQAFSPILVGDSD